MKKNDEVYTLDCSATIYPYIGRKDLNQSYNMEADLDRDVDPQLLKKAVHRMCERFPTMFVCLHKDAFGYKLRHMHETDSLVRPRPDELHRPFAMVDGEPMIRVFYRGNWVAIEAFHVVSDGTGVIVLLKSVLAEYFRLLGEEIPNTDGILSPLDSVKETEIEDSFRKNFKKDFENVPRSGEKAFQYRPEGPFEAWHQTELTMPVSAIKAVSKAHGATLTEFLAAVYLQSFYETEEGKRSRKPIALSVPVNLRPMFTSESLRNFSLYFIASTPRSGEGLTFDEILENVKKQFKEGTDRKLLFNMLCTNAAQADMPVFTAMPRGLKHIILKIGAILYGECLFTSVLSNLGVVRMPAQLQQHVKMFRVVLGHTPLNKIKATAYCYGDTFGLMFSSELASREIENNMQRLLEAYDIPTKLVPHD